MGRLFSRRKYRDLMLGLALLCAVLALMRWPQESMAAARDGLALCGNVIIPSLFPFFVLSSLVVELGMSRYLGRLLEGVMAPLFRVGGACSSALALGFVGGYPVGARTAIALYENGQCSKTEAERLLAFCNNSGPAFILGVVGTGIFASSRAGLLLYLAHIAASLCVGLLFRFYRPGEGPRPGRHAAPQFQAASFPVAFTHSITGALSSTLNICAFVLFFTVVIRMLFLSGVMGALAGGAAALLSPLGLDPGMGSAAHHRPVGALLRVSSLTGAGTVHRPAVHGRLHAGLGRPVRPLPGAGLSGGLRPVHGDLPVGQVTPRPALRRPAGPADPAVSPGRPGVLLSGRAD